MSLEFRNWLEASDPTPTESGPPGKIPSYLKQNPKDPSKYFFVVYGDTFKIKDKLGRNGLGMSYFQSTWSIPVSMLTDEKKVQLAALNVDLSCLNAPLPQPKPPTMAPAAQAEPDNKFLAQMKREVDKAMGESDPQVRTMLQNIDKVIENVANMADEAAKQEFIRGFLKFSSKFHNYSFQNQIMIWSQSGGKAKHVAGAGNWQKLGRMVSNWKNPIWILRPNFVIIKKQVADAATGGTKEEATTLKRFRAVKVYDVADTEVIPGHASPFMPLTRKDWSKDSNESREEIDALINATHEYIKGKNIKIDSEELGNVGGLSKGGSISINSTFKGVNYFSTLVHELAHETIHWVSGREHRVSRQFEEIDAETTAFVVLDHFGIETKDTPNYLALWRASGDAVRGRKQTIQKAATEIINGIKAHMNKPVDVDADGAGTEPEAA